MIVENPNNFDNITTPKFTEHDCSDGEKGILEFIKSNKKYPMVFRSTRSR